MLGFGKRQERGREWEEEQKEGEDGQKFVAGKPEEKVEEGQKVEEPVAEEELEAV